MDAHSFFSIPHLADGECSTAVPIMTHLTLLKGASPGLHETYRTSIMSSDPTSLTPYNAHCHCGKVKYTVSAPNLWDNEVVSCNCSICTRNGYLGVFIHRKDIVFQTGYDDLVSYNFGRSHVSHKFCPVCSSSLLVDFHDMDRIAINVSIPLTYVPLARSHKTIQGSNVSSI